MEASIILSIPLSEFIEQVEQTVRKVLNEKQENTDRLLSSKEVMQLLNISSTSLQTWRDQGKIPFTRMGKNKIYYSREKIMALASDRN